MSEHEPAAVADPPPSAAGPAPDDPPPGSAAPAAETEPADAGADTGTGRTAEIEQSLHVGSAAGSTIQQVATLIEALNVEVVAQQSRQAVRLFTCAEGAPLSEAQEAASAARYHGSSAEMDDLLAHLEDKRVLLLTAERGARKVSAAICLAWHLRQRGSCRNPTLLVSSLDRQVHIDAHHLAERDPQLAGRMVVFRQPFGRRDPELARLLDETDRSGWEQIADLLRERRAYLVFTADPDDARLFRGRPATSEHVRPLLPHPRDVLERELDARLEALAGDSAPALLAALSAGRERLLQEFHFVPSLAEFLDFYVDQDRPEMEVGEAVARFNDTSRWLLQELEEDFEGWSFGFTLALAHAVRGAQGVPWMDFDRLHRRVRQWLRRDMNPRAPAAGAEPDPDGSALPPAVSEMPLLKRCRAEIVKDSSTLSDVIRFRDGTPPQRLWDVILDRHRRALTTILPGLSEMAENRETEPRSLRVLAAQIIGRIGEVDPQRVALPLMEHWVRAPDRRHHMAVGALCEGVLGSSSTEYHQRCLGRLRPIAAGSASRSEAAEQWLLAAIGAYSWIGDHELVRAMDELEAIVCRHLVPMIGDLQEFARAFDDVERELQASPSAKENDSLRRWHVLLRKAIDQIHQKDAKVLLGVQRSLVSLCLTAGPIPVFIELQRWIWNTGWKMGVLVALMFLNERGIARRLKESRVEVAAGGDGATISCNPLVLWIAAGEDEVRKTADFLGDLYKSLNTPFTVDVRLRRSFQVSLQGHLVEWVRDALPVPQYEDSMRLLFQALARTHRGILHEPLAQLLARRDFREADDHRLRAFAASIQL